MSTTSRSIKWHPPPNPNFLHFPRRRRIRRKHPKPTTLHLHSQPRSKSFLLLNRPYLSSRENDELPKTNGTPVVLLGSNSKTSAIERRERVKEEKKERGEYSGGGFNISEEEKWMSQAEILRAECSLLRMERELALKKLEKNRVKMEKTLRSAVQTLVSGRKKIFEGKSVNAMLEKELEDLSEKLEEFGKRSRIKSNEFRNSSNFDKKASSLEKLGELSDESCVTELQGFSESSYASGDNGKSSQESILHEEKRCSGLCKAIVSKIVEQVRSETEQWSQMQEMLGQVRAEMEQLQSSRDFWENRARHSHYEIQSLKHAMEEWRERAHAYEMKANELQLELCVLGYQLKENQHSNIDEKVCKLIKEELNIEENKEITRSKDLAPISLCKQLAKEKRVLLRRLKEKHRGSAKSYIIQECEKASLLDGRGKPHTNSIRPVPSNRSPLRDIGNSLSISLPTQKGSSFSLSLA